MGCIVAAFLSLFVLSATPSWAQARGDLGTQLGSRAQARIEQMLGASYKGHWIGQVAIAPDGARIAWVDGGRGGERIHVAPFDHLDQAQSVSAGANGGGCDEHNPVWAPDSKALAFLSDCEEGGGQANLYLWGAQAGAPRRLTRLHGYVNAPAFAPDGSAIAFLYVPGATRPAGALAAQDPAVGVIGEEHIEVQRVAVVSANSSLPAEPAFATPPQLHVFEFDWSPDSKQLAYIASDAPGENNWWVARLYTQPITASLALRPSDTTSEQPKLILAPSAVPGPLHGMQIAVPRWSPDGSRIAFIGGLMSDQGVTGGDVWVVPSAGGGAHDLTPGRAASPAWLAWDGNHRIFAAEIAGGDSRLVALNLHGQGDAQSAQAGSPIFQFPGTVSDGRLSRSLSSTANRSLFVFIASSFDRAPEIYAARPAQPSPQPLQLTHMNDGVAPMGGKTLSLQWMNGGLHVQGWLLLPTHYDPAKKYPLIVEVHGGPASVMLPRWAAGGPLSPSAFSALGYFVLLPNPRGSFGQGEAFTQANRKDFGYGDLRDILAGVDTVLASYPVDPERVGITGWSYGGFMTMFAVTQTHRFKAAVAGAGISDWLSYYGENSIDQWMIPYFGASVYDDPQVYAKSSAINFIRQARTPALIVVGERDGECPAPQSFEFWHALRDLHVPAELVVYPNEGHGFVNPRHQADVLQRAADWFARYMPEKP